MKVYRLELQDVAVRLRDQGSILEHVNLAIPAGEIHAIMGPNGSGKSTLAQSLLGHPGYELTKGKILLDGEEVQTLRTEERAKRGMFLTFQHPVAIPGVSVANVVRRAHRVLAGEISPDTATVAGFRKKLEAAFSRVQLSKDFMRRGINDGFSGGERKKVEIIQAAMLAPRMLILDEIDSGLDVDALRSVVAEIQRLYDAHHPAILLITHYTRILKLLKPHAVHILKAGTIVQSGGPELADTIEEKGYTSAL